MCVCGVVSHKIRNRNKESNDFERVNAGKLALFDANSQGRPFLKCFRSHLHFGVDSVTHLIVHELERVLREAVLLNHCGAAVALRRPLAVLERAQPALKERLDLRARACVCVSWK